MEEVAATLTPEQKRELLERFVPHLRYDSQAAFYAVSVETVTGNPTNRLMRGRRVLAAASGVPALTLDVLASPARKKRRLRALTKGGRAFDPGPRDTEAISKIDRQSVIGAAPSSGDDRIHFGPDRIEDARRMQADPELADRVYGRVVEQGEQVHLQYWLWFYGAALQSAYVIPRILYRNAVDLDSGAWRLVQVVLDHDHEPSRVILGGPYAQSRAWGRATARGDHAVVHIAPLTQELFFEPGIFWRRGRWDGSDGTGRRVVPRIEDFTGWESWPGRWGKEYDAPRSPADWKAWKRPGHGSSQRLLAAFVRVARWVRPRGSHERVPALPSVAARLEHREAVILYELGERPPAALLITVHPAGAKEVVGCAMAHELDQSGQVHVAVPRDLACCDVRISALSPAGRRRRLLLKRIASNAADSLEQEILRGTLEAQLLTPDIARYAAEYDVPTTELKTAVTQREGDVWRLVATDLQAFRDARAQQLRDDRATVQLRKARGKAAWATVVLLTGLTMTAIAFATDAYWFVVAAGLLFYAEILLIDLLVGPSLKHWRDARAALRASRARPWDREGVPLEAPRAAFERALAERAVAPFLREEINRKTVDQYRLELGFGARGLSELSSPASEIRTKASEELENLTSRMSGGSVGIAGPRGVGKSTLIRVYCQPRTVGDRRLAVELSAPVRYDAREFVLMLFARLCDAVSSSGEADPASQPKAGARLGWLPILLVPIAAGLGWRSLDGDPVWWRYVLAGLAAATAAGAIGVVLRLRWKELLYSVTAFAAAGPLALATASMKPDQLWRSMTLAGGILAAMVGIYYMVVGARRLVDPLATPEDRLRALADEARDEIRFQQSWSQGYSGRLSLPLGGMFSMDRQRKLERRQVTYPELVDRLRRFLTVAFEARGEVAIGIDEMDKMESSETAEAFLNEVKSVFGVEGCYFLVSVSENAVSAFDRRGLPFRDVFDSSFDEVLTLHPLPLADSTRLLRGRVLALGPAFIDLAHCLSGGLARDLLRVTRRLSLLANEEGAERSIADVCRRLVTDELIRQSDAGVTAAQAVGLEPHRTALQLWMRGFRTVEVTTGAALRRASAARPDHWPVGPSGDSDAAAGFDQLERLGADLAAYTYYLATIVDVFTEDVECPQASFRAAETIDEESGECELDRLAQARVALAINPGIAVSIVDEFRARRAWPTQPSAWRQPPVSQSENGATGTEASDAPAPANP